MDFSIGMTLDIDGECLGTITEMTEDRIYIDSPCFRGWATKDEIAAAAKLWATEEQSQHTPPERPAFAA